MNFENINSPTDIIVNGLSVTVLGLVVVFAVLVIIMLFIYAMTAFFKRKAEKPTEEYEVEVEKEEAPVAEEVIEETQPDESELIAVITAAIASCMDRSTASIRVKSYKKVSSAWSGAAKNDILNRF